MKPAVLVVDVLNDNVHGEHAGPGRDAALAVVPAINRLLAAAHARGWPVVFACDAFQPDDFLFGGRMRPHSLRGTPGAQPIPELDRAPGDEILPKPRFSAFFRTNLERTLRDRGVDSVLVCGLTTAFCVLATAFDALSHDFRAVLVEDACASSRPEWHAATLEIYRKNVLRPLFRVRTVAEILGTPGSLDSGSEPQA